MALSLRIIVALLLALPLQVAADFLPAGIDAEHFRTWFWATSTVVENWLYIAGGEIYYLDDTTNTVKQKLNTKLLAVDLSESWSVDNVSATINTSDDRNLIVRQPTLWYNGIKNIVNVYGGWPYADAVSPVHVSAFTPGDGAVTLTSDFKKSDDSSFQGLTRKTGGLVASSPSAYYNVGGMGTDSTDPDFGSFSGLYSAYFTLSGMLVFDFATETWTNETVNNQRLYGEAQYVPIFGDQGVLVLLGGDRPTTQYPYSKGSSLADMDSISVYDIANKKWYEQKATGTIPKARYQFCSVVSAASSNTSYEIYIFGGTQADFIAPDLEIEMGRVYILSLPAFVWTRAPASSAWRYAHYCQVIGSRQMLSIGGAAADWSAKDSFANGLQVFDMVDLTWKTNYDAKAKPYQRPTMVESLYVNGKPNATVTWTFPELRTIFKVKNDPASTSGSPSSNSTSGTSPSGSKNNIAGPVAGGVIGGVAVIAAVAFGIWYLRRRRVQTDNGPASKYQPVGLGGNKANEMYDPTTVHEMNPLQWQKPSYVHDVHDVHEANSVQWQKPSNVHEMYNSPSPQQHEMYNPTLSQRHELYNSPVPQQYEMYSSPSPQRRSVHGETR